MSGKSPSFSGSHPINSTRLNKSVGADQTPSFEALLPGSGGKRNRRMRSIPDPATIGGGKKGKAVTENFNPSSLHANENGDCKQAITVPIFLQKTYNMINSCDPAIASWTDDGEMIVVKDPDKFAKEVIPQYFDHSKFTSFARQLNFYGFRKMQSKTIRNADFNNQTAKHVTFYNEKFKRGRCDLLKEIQRSTRGSGANVSNLQEQQKEIEELKKKVKTLEGQMADMINAFENQKKDMEKNFKQLMDSFLANTNAAQIHNQPLVGQTLYQENGLGLNQSGILPSPLVPDQHLEDFSKTFDESIRGDAPTQKTEWQSMPPPVKVDTNSSEIISSLSLAPPNTTAIMPPYQHVKPHDKEKKSENYLKKEDTRTLPSESYSSQPSMKPNEKPSDVTKATPTLPPHPYVARLKSLGESFKAPSPPIREQSFLRGYSQEFSSDAFVGNDFEQKFLQALVLENGRNAEKNISEGINVKPEPALDGNENLLQSFISNNIDGDLPAGGETQETLDNATIPLQSQPNRIARNETVSEPLETPEVSLSDF